jgi:hypothetical protein
MYALYPDAQSLSDYLQSVGVSDSEIGTVQANPGMLLSIKDGTIAGGLDNLSAARIAHLRSSAGTYLTWMPERCALTIIGAAIGGASTQGLIDGSLDEGSALAAGLVGLAFSGVGLSLLP